MPSPRFFFDFLSPYSYLASALLQTNARLAALGVVPEPLPVGSVMARLQLRGPGEIEVKRRAILDDCLLLAQRYGIPFEGPPRQPFASLPALRSVLHEDDPQARTRLMHRYFQACWGEGRDLEDPRVLRDCAREVGLDQDPEAVARSLTARRSLKRNVSEALELGVFGVPTLVCPDGTLFFGHDRLDLARAYLSGELSLDRERARELLGRPRMSRVV